MTAFALAGLVLFAALCIGAVLQRRQSYAVGLRGSDLPGGSDSLVGPRASDNPFALGDAPNGDLTVTGQPASEYRRSGTVAAVACDPVEGDGDRLVRRVPPSRLLMDSGAMDSPLLARHSCHAEYEPFTVVEAQANWLAFHRKVK